MPERVLIVEDEEDLRYVLVRQLRMDGYQIETAVDGEEAIQKIQTDDYAVIITDMRMPRKDGLTVVSAAREFLPEAEVIVLTGHGSLENALQAFKAGNIFAYLLKPLDDIGVLNTQVAHAIERRNMRRHNKQLFEQLQQAYEELKQKSETLVQNAKMSAIGTLAVGVAHELNNPLTAVVGFAQILQEKLKNQRPLNWSEEDYQHVITAVENLVQGAHRSRDIVSSLLRYVRPSRAEMRTPVDIHQVLRNVFVFTEHLLLRNGIALHKQFASDLHPIQANPSRLQHVFMNLIVNAQQATPSGGTVTVCTEWSEHPKGVWVHVEDTGVGIASEDLPHIFEPFFTRRDEGTGLGLSLVRQIVEEHGGQIEVWSEVGKGTRFSVFLPAEGVREQSPPDEPSLFSEKVA
ncbi:MAG: hypothetical protein C4337_04480 [Armatimonadota bacterium]